MASNEAAATPAPPEADANKALADAFVTEFFSTHRHAYVAKMPDRSGGGRCKRFENTIRELSLTTIQPMPDVLPKGSAPFVFSLVYTSLAEMQQKTADNWDETAETEDNVPYALDRYPLAKVAEDAVDGDTDQFIDVIMDYKTQRIIDGECDAQFRRKKTLVFDRDRSIILCIEVEYDGE